MVHFIREDHEVIKYDSISAALDEEVFFDSVIIVDFNMKKTFVYNDKGELEKAV